MFEMCYIYIVMCINICEFLKYIITYTVYTNTHMEVVAAAAEAVVIM
jgi:hypothetical protein